jgi:hypothetical protein
MDRLVRIHLGRPLGWSVFRKRSLIGIVSWRGRMVLVELVSLLWLIVILFGQMWFETCSLLAGEKPLAFLVNWTRVRI